MYRVKKQAINGREAWLSFQICYFCLSKYFNNEKKSKRRLERHYKRG